MRVGESTRVEDAAIFDVDDAGLDVINSYLPYNIS